MKALAVILIMLVAALPVAAQTSTPEQPPAPLPLPTMEMYQALSTANANIGNSPNSAPPAAPILPGEDGHIVFGYAKWLLSFSNAEEYAGPFAPLIQHLGIYVMVNMSLISVYSLVYAASYLFGWFAWLAQWFYRFVDLVVQVLQVLVSNPIILLVVIVLGGFALLIVVLGALFGLNLSGLFGG